MRFPWFGRKAAASEFRHGGALLPWGRSAPDLAKITRDINHGLDVSVVMGVIQWLQRAIVEADLELYRVTDDGEEVLRSHEVLDLLAQPNPYYSGDHLLQATIFSWVDGGNGFWVKVGSQANRQKPVELWYVPHWMMEPQYPRDGSLFLSSWRYRAGIGDAYYAPDEIVHFRHGIDPHQPRCGISPIRSAFREAWSDQDSARLVSQMLSNNAIPGLVLSPKSGEAAIPDPEEVKKDVRAKFRGVHRGDPLVMTGPTDVQRVSWNPEELDLSSVRNVAEERLCVLLGVHAAVVGYGTGMEQTKVGATMRELRKMSWQNGVMPLLHFIESELDRSIGPDFFDEREGWRFRFNVDRVDALQEDRGELVTRVMDQLKGGAITRGKAKELLGHDVEPDDDVYLLPINVMVVPRGDAGASRNRDPEQRSAAEPGQKEAKEGHDHTPFEERMAATAPRATRVPEQLEAVMRQLDTARPTLEEAFAADLVPVFDDLGQKAERAALEVLGQKDELDTARIMELLTLGATGELMREAFERHYVQVARVTNETVSAAIGVATDLPDPVARAVFSTGGRRAGLIDLEGQTKRRIFDAIGELREEGAGPEEIARRIRADVARGPWATPATRAKVIARTETKFAQNVSSLERARVEGITQALIFDARLGPTDEVCMALNGRIVTLQEAEQLAIDEHPNGTRSFTPLPPALAEEITP